MPDRVARPNVRVRPPRGCLSPAGVAGKQTGRLVLATPPPHGKVWLGDFAMAIVRETLRAVKVTTRKTVKRGGKETTREHVRETRRRKRKVERGPLVFGRGNA